MSGSGYDLPVKHSDAAHGFEKVSSLSCCRTVAKVSAQDFAALSAAVAAGRLGKHEAYLDDSSCVTSTSKQPDDWQGEKISFGQGLASMMNKEELCKECYPRRKPGTPHRSLFHSQFPAAPLVTRRQGAIVPRSRPI